MNVIAALGINTLPDALYFMATRERIVGKTLIQHLDACAEKHGGCDNCPYQWLCEKTYRQLIESETTMRGARITNWRGMRKVCS